MGVAFLMWLVLPLGSWAVGGSAQSKASENPIVIKGRTADESGAPHPAASVRLLRPGSDREEDTIAAATSGKDGSFHIQTSSFGPHQLLIEARGRLPKKVELELTRERTEVDVGTVRLDVDCSSPEVQCDDFGITESVLGPRPLSTAEATFHLRGTVSDRAGKAIEGATVRLLRFYRLGAEQDDPGLAGTTSNRDGTFLLEAKTRAFPHWLTVEAKGRSAAKIRVDLTLERTEFDVGTIRLR